MRASPARWVGSIVATFVSTYVLDLAATAAGVLLVASGLLDDLNRSALLGVLVISYAGWGLGLRMNLRANLDLLDRTGVSTNVLSKAAYAFAVRRSAGVRARRLAANSGYVLSEVLKEAPYYLGAFGATALSAGLGADDAIVFLAGANLGAGLYEYGLSGLTRGFLQRTRGGGPHAVIGVVEQRSDCGLSGSAASASELVPGDDLGGHLANPPGVVPAGMHDGVSGGIIPRVQQAPSGPNPGPVALNATFSSTQHVWRGVTTEDDDKTLVHVVAEQDGDAAARELRSPAALRLGENGLPH